MSTSTSRVGVHCRRVLDTVSEPLFRNPADTPPDPGELATYVRACMAKDQLRSGIAWWPLDPDYLADPYPMLRRLRETDPCHRSTATGYVLVSRYEDVDRLLRDHERFALTPTGRKDDDPDALARLEEISSSPADPRYVKSMLHTEQPEHTRLRRLARQALSIDHMEQMEDYVRATAHKLLDRTVETGAFELMSTFADPLPVRVVGRMAGWPEREFAIFNDWVFGRRRQSVPAFAPVASKEVRAQILRVEIMFGRRLAKLVEERRADPRDDLVSRLVHAESRQDRLALSEVDTMLRLLLGVGNHATADLIGNGLLALLRHPEQMQLLRERPDLLPDAVEELLRYDAPSQVTCRWSTEDTEIAGRSVAAGSRVALLLGGANRDPDRFGRPDELDLTRSDKRHVSFGRGIHYCLGAPLAKLIGRVALEVLLDRFADIRIADPPPAFKPTAVPRGLRHLHVRVRRGRQPTSADDRRGDPRRSRVGDRHVATRAETGRVGDWGVAAVRPCP